MPRTVFAPHFNLILFHLITQEYIFHVKEKKNKLSTSDHVIPRRHRQNPRFKSYCNQKRFKMNSPQCRVSPTHPKHSNMKLTVKTCATPHPKHLIQKGGKHAYPKPRSAEPYTQNMAELVKILLSNLQEKNLTEHHVQYSEVIQDIPLHCYTLSIRA